MGSEGYSSPQEISPGTRDEMFTYWEHAPSLGMTGLPMSRDHNFTSEKVASLNNLNFEDALRHSQVCMVMFYSPCDENGQKYRDWFSQAACSTQRERHLYAAVNCNLDEEICRTQGSSTTPAYSMYSKGQRIGFFGDYRNMTPELMRSFVETAPVFPRPRREQELSQEPRLQPGSVFDNIGEKHTFSTFTGYSD